MGTIEGLDTGTIDFRPEGRAEWNQASKYDQLRPRKRPIARSQCRVHARVIQFCAWQCFEEESDFDRSWNNSESVHGHSYLRCITYVSVTDGHLLSELLVWCTVSHRRILLLK